MFNTVLCYFKFRFFDDGVFLCCLDIFDGYAFVDDGGGGRRECG